MVRTLECPIWKVEKQQLSHSESERDAEERLSSKQQKPTSILRTFHRQMATWVREDLDRIHKSRIQRAPRWKLLFQGISSTKKLRG